jgi:hypothetical protein
MTKNTNLAEAFVKDFTELGYAKKESDLSMRSLDGETLIEFDSLLGEDNEVVGLQVFSNGVQIEELLYSDDSFSEKLSNRIVNELNI